MTDEARAGEPRRCPMCGGHAIWTPAKYGPGTLAAAAPALDVERIFRLFADAHFSNVKGQRAGYELAALAEDWFDANVDGGWPLPRVARPSEKAP